MIRWLFALSLALLFWAAVLKERELMREYEEMEE